MYGIIYCNKLYFIESNSMRFANMKRTVIILMVLIYRTFRILFIQCVFNGHFFTNYK